jgi:phosphomannomutase
MEYLRDEGLAEKGIVVGYDRRFLSPEFAQRVAEIAAGNGIGVLFCRAYAPTPAVSWAVHREEAGAGIMITASHNPAAYNGFKIKEWFGGSARPSTTKKLEERIASCGTGPAVREIPFARAKAEGIVKIYDPREAYFRQLASYVDLDLIRRAGLRVLVDPMHGAGAGFLSHLLPEVTEIHGEENPSFGGVPPEPTEEHLGELSRMVKGGGFDVGLALDGDADRIGAVDETGEIIYGDQLLVILGRDAVRRFGPGTPVIFDVKCSEVLPAALRAAGAEPVMWKTGHSLIKAKMKELAAPLAGEMSGHMFFGGDYLGFDDALFAAARLLEIVSRQPFGLAPLLADLPRTTTTPEIRVDVPEAEKFAIVEAAARYFTARYPVNTIDGIRITFPDGWGLLRASNTQPILVLRFEASNPQSLDAARSEVVGWLAGRGVRA